MRCTIRQVEAFLAIARHEHFGRAAEDLKISQPTISADLRGFERALGVTLVARSRGGSRLTEAGRAVLPHARQLLEVGARLETAASGAPETIRLAVTPSMVNRLVPELLEQFEREPGTLEIEVLTVATGGVEECVAQGEADAGLGHYLRATRGARRATLGEDPLHALSAHGVLTPDRPVPLDDLAGRSLQLWPREQNPVYFDALLAVCHDHGLDPELVGASSELSGARSYRLRTGESFALVPADYAREAPASLSHAPLDPPAVLPLQILYRTPAGSGITDLVKGIRRLRADQSSARF